MRAARRTGKIVTASLASLEVRFRTVLFDFDGTLVDSGAMILESFRHATRAVLRRELPDEELIVLAGEPLPGNRARALAGDRTDELVRVYREHNTSLHADLAAFDGILAVLEQLQLERRRLGLVTAKHVRTVRLAFELVALEPFFEVVVTPDDTERHKPHPEPILLALERLDAEPAAAAYVGDSPFDVRAAKAAGVFSVAVTWGGIHTRETLEREAPDALVDTPGELLAVL
jgi:pyrophosphatase PpaX